VELFKGERERESENEEEKGRRGALVRVRRKMIYENEKHKPFYSTSSSSFYLVNEKCFWFERDFQSSQTP
jgi:hypothetical protein